MPLDLCLLRISEEWRVKRGPAWSLSTLLHQRGGALADFFKRRFEATKLLRTQFGEYPLHLPGVFSERLDNKVFAARGEGNDPNTPVISALNTANQAFLDKAVYGDTARTWGQIDDWAYRIDGQRTFVQQDFQHSEIREAKSGFFNTSSCVPCQGANRLHHYKPDMICVLNALGHKKLNPPGDYAITYIDVNILDVMLYGLHGRRTFM